MYQHQTNSPVAGVLAPPPLLFLAAWLSAEALHRRHPLPLRRGRRDTGRIAGAVAIGAGLLLSGVVMRRFHQAGTPVSPLHPTLRLVVDGPYRYTRNADYLGQLLIYCGASVAANRAWPLLLLPPPLTLLRDGVVLREEAYLTRVLGPAYRAYAEKVPRWL